MTNQINAYGTLVVLDATLADIEAHLPRTFTRVEYVEEDFRDHLGWYRAIARSLSNAEQSSLHAYVELFDQYDQFFRTIIALEQAVFSATGGPNLVVIEVDANMPRERATQLLRFVLNASQRYRYLRFKVLMPTTLFDKSLGFTDGSKLLNNGRTIRWTEQKIFC